MSNNHLALILLWLLNSTASVLASVAKSLPEEVHCNEDETIYSIISKNIFTEILGMHLNKNNCIVATVTFNALIIIVITSVMMIYSVVGYYHKLLQQL